ncbi:MAG: DUF3520 domain-containing protein, partial [bacterium]|nr:DUF3520 domain-containing protein [bacterium]
QIDPLKYQETRLTPAAAARGEALTVKLRYKEPRGAESKLLSRAVAAGEPSQASESFRFATAVAGFGMLLRDSKHKGECTWQTVAAMADQAKGNDPDGRRSEFVYLLKTAGNLAASSGTGSSN